jgi:hypothetical protein
MTTARQYCGWVLALVWVLAGGNTASAAKEQAAQAPQAQHADGDKCPACAHCDEKKAAATGKACAAKKSAKDVHDCPVCASKPAVPAAGTSSCHLSQPYRPLNYVTPQAHAQATPSNTGDLWKDHVICFNTSLSGSTAAMNPGTGVKLDYRACESIATGLEACAFTLVDLHDDSLRKYGNEFQGKLEMLALNAHRLRIACAERNPEAIERYWGQLGIVHKLLAATTPWR